MIADTRSAPDTASETGQLFREAMAALAATTCVVSAAQGDERVGRTVTAALSLAVDPPSLLVSIDSSARLAALIRARRGFSFAMLQSDQGAVAEAFAGKGPRERRFEHGTWEPWQSGHPRLRGAMAAMDCIFLPVRWTWAITFSSSDARSTSTLRKGAAPSSGTTVASIRSIRSERSSCPRDLPETPK